MDRVRILGRLGLVGKIAELKQARRQHNCAACPLPIKPGEFYYCVTTGGGGLGSLKFPDRVHEPCLDDYLKGN